MGKFQDLTGQRFGRLTVINRTQNKGNKVVWKCKCDCGNETETTSYHLKSGQTTSCGCYHKERVAQTHTKHGERHSKLYAVWIAMKDRCDNPNNKDYHDYGARKITVCSEWLDKENGFISFNNWSIDNGYKYGLTLDRIDNEKGYSPNNCRWVTQKEQCNNKRNNHKIAYDGKELTMMQWACILGIPYRTLERRINKYNWTTKKALTTPVKIKKHIKNRSA